MSTILIAVEKSHSIPSHSVPFFRLELRFFQRLVVIWWQRERRKVKSAQTSVLGGEERGKKRKGRRRGKSADRIQCEQWKGEERENEEERERKRIRIKMRRRKDEISSLIYGSVQEEG